MNERLKQQLEFILEIDKEKSVFRQTHISGFSRYENDAEHAWHMAVMIWLLKEYANEEFDVGKAMMMALIHDVVEIDAGDTYAYDDMALKSQSEREEKAAKRIFGLLPKDQRDELRSLFYEFEEGVTPEAKFAKAMDNLQPLLLNDSNNGGDWKIHDVNTAQVLKRQSRTEKGSKELWELTKGIIEKNVLKGNLKEE
jgi:putative hydrolase of HD superfamily